MTPRVASYGGGVNSTAMLIELCRLDSRVDLILFSDTGGEKPETYEYAKRFSFWLLNHGMQSITVVRDPRRTLEQDCIDRHSLPSIVRGIRSCSDVFKIRPQDRFLKSWQPAMEAWERGDKVTKLVGFDAGEAHRVKKFDSPRFTIEFPLVEWGWDRERCLHAIESAGLPVPPKSSCFFCPEMHEQEIIELNKAHPDLMERAFAMERGNTAFYDVRGLARTHSWEQIVDYHKRQMTLPYVGGDMPCMCFDGEE